MLTMMITQDENVGVIMPFYDTLRKGSCEPKQVIDFI